MGPARIYPCRKMHRSRAPSIAPGTFFVAQPWADCITNMPGFNSRQAQAPPVRASKTHLMLVAFTTERFTGVGKSVKELTDRHLACCWYRPPAHSLRQMMSALTKIIIEFESPPPK